MSKQKFKLMIDLVEKFFNNHSNAPLYYLVAKDGKQIFSNDEVAPQTDGNYLLERYIKNYFESLKYDISEIGLHDWDSDAPERAVFVKLFGKPEKEFYEKLSNYGRIDKDKFLRKQYQLRYFNLELRLNDKQSVHLHQHISTGYQTNWKIHIKFFENTEKFEVIDYTKGFTIGQNFDFVSYIDKENPQDSFSIIQSTKWFEKLYDLIEEYKNAYEKVMRFNYLDLTALHDGTEDCWRKCYSLLKYPKLDQCLSALTVELLSNDSTPSKNVLKEKGINYRIDSDGKPIIAPENPLQLKAVIKILSDRLVDTHFLKRIGISDYIEEIKG